MTARAFVVANPVAGGGRTRRLWPRLRDRLAHLGLAFEFAETSGPGSATTLARQAVAGGWPLVVAVGGDGTVNEVVNGLVDPLEGPPATLGVVVTGRGRDICRNLRVATDPETAARRLVEGEDARVDLGVAEWPGHRRYFVNAAGIGFDATVAERARVGGGSGTLPYLLAVLSAVRAHRAAPASVALDDGRTWTGPMTAAVVANGAHYGGGMKIAPAADPADGRLEVIVVGDLGRLELLRWLPAVYRGTHLANPRVTSRAARVVAIEAPVPLPMHLDGEPVGETPVRLAVCPGALRLRR